MRSIYAYALPRDVEAVIFQPLPLPLQKMRKRPLTIFLTFVGL